MLQIDDSLVGLAHFSFPHRSKLNHSRKLSLKCDTGENTVNSPDFLVWKFCEKTQFSNSFGRFARNCAFPQNFHTRKSDEITVSFAV